jgi:hypothetical protein
MLAPHRRRVRRSVAQRFAKALLHTYWNAAEPDGADASSPATLSPKLKVVPAKFSEALLCSVDPLTLMKYLAPFSPAPRIANDSRSNDPYQSSCCDRRTRASNTVAGVVCAVAVADREAAKWKYGVGDTNPGPCIADRLDVAENSRMPMASMTLRFQYFGMLLSPADGMNAAAHKTDFGTSPWQLSDEITLAAGVRERGRAMAAHGRRGQSVAAQWPPCKVGFGGQADIGQPSPGRPRFMAIRLGFLATSLGLFTVWKLFPASVATVLEGKGLPCLSPIDSGAIPRSPLLRFASRSA